MIRLASASPPKPRTAAQQQADFTAEGAPPPGAVGPSLPATQTRPAKPAAPGAARSPAAPAC